MKQDRILICNDDGINAEGIHVLEEAARRLSDDVWVVAPAFEQSGKGHSFTAKGNLTAVKIDDRHFTVDGTPTDCILFACNVLLKNHKPDFVFSGVNHGSNLGFDVLYSGTTGVAIEGTLQGIKSFAFSLYGAKQGSAYWSMIPEVLPKVVEKTKAFEWPAHTFLNVNFSERAADQIKGALALLLPGALRQPVPFFRSKSAAQTRCNAHGVHCRLDEHGARTTERVVQNRVRVNMGKVDDARRQCLLDRGKHCIFAVAALVQSGAGSIQRDHHLVMVDAKLHRIGSAGLLKPAEVVHLLQTGDNRLFDDRLAVGDAEQLRL